MNKIAAMLFAITILMFTGCTAMNTMATGVSQKSISGSGTVAYGNVGLDAATLTPEVSGLFVWGDYTSVVAGDEIFRYEESEDASVFNSSAVTKRKKIFFASGDKSRMDEVIKAITKPKEPPNDSD